ncbi:MAG: FtsX-like permease family protein, partial [Acidobacteria bacterium]|nr:FtsX-like permease family protein [Acidobacteriota bacterium]
LSTMMTLAIERRREIGLLKALGGSGRDVRRLFLAEAGLLALPAGLLGAGLGLALSQWLGQAVFASAVSLRWVTLPAAVAVALAVAVAGTLAALQLAGRAEPAVILRGE